jgi:V/A-type H+-transporting ATPase subunit A
VSNAARLVRISGALVEAAPCDHAGLFELVRVGPRELLGEVVQLIGQVATIIVYEDTTGLRLGDSVATTGAPLSVELGPGLLGAVLDGVGRPLAALATEYGDFVQPGAQARTLDQERHWDFVPALQPGAHVSAGDVLGTVEEKPGFLHRILLPFGVSGDIDELSAGAFAVADTIGRLTDGLALTLSQSWPVRQPRALQQRLPPDRPFITGQRVFDLLFPVAEGGAVALPGGFGTGKTVVEQSLAKYADADIVVYVGCGERGNGWRKCCTTSVSCVTRAPAARSWTARCSS